ncbi:MAG: hypothetical protein WA064_05480 [Candidatus Moraniibacteriota bacterium]
MQKYWVTNFSFCSEEAEYLTGKAFKFHHLSAYGRLLVNEDESLHCQLGSSMPEVQLGSSMPDIWPESYFGVRFPGYKFYGELKRIGGFVTHLDRVNSVIKEINLSKGTYRLTHTCHPIFEFTERQPAGNLVMFTLHAEIVSP